MIYEMRCTHDSCRSNPKTGKKRLLAKVHLVVGVVQIKCPNCGQLCEVANGTTDNGNGRQDCDK